VSGRCSGNVHRGESSHSQYDGRHCCSLNPHWLNIGGTGQDSPPPGGSQLLAQAANSVVSSRAITSADLLQPWLMSPPWWPVARFTTSVLKTSTALVATGGGATAPVLASRVIAQQGNHYGQPSRLDQDEDSPMLTFGFLCGITTQTEEVTRWRSHLFQVKMGMPWGIRGKIWPDAVPSLLVAINPTDGNPIHSPEMPLPRVSRWGWGRRLLLTAMRATLPLSRLAPPTRYPTHCRCFQANTQRSDDRHNRDCPGFLDGAGKVVTNASTQGGLMG